MSHARRARSAVTPMIALAAMMALASCQSGAIATTSPNPMPGASAAVAPSPATTAAAAALRSSPSAAGAATGTAAVPAAATPDRRPVAGAAPPASVIRFSAYATAPGDSAVAIIRPDGSGRGALPDLPGGPWGPRLSPDGALLLFSTAVPVAPGRAQDLDLNGSGSPDIWVAGADGTGARRLIGGGGGYNGWSWSPDGRRIAFASNRAGSWDLYVIGADGTGLARITASPSQDGWPAWLPGGTALVFASTRSDRAQLYRVAAGGGAVERLLSSPTVDTEPAVARDGRIAFSSQAPDGTGEIAVLDPAGGSPRAVTSRGGLNTSPAWSPDGMRLTFVGLRDGRGDLFAIGADGGSLRQLTTTGQNLRPDWGIAPPDTLAPLMLDNLARTADRRRSGTLEVIVDDGRGTLTTTAMRFDLGDPNRPPRLQRTTRTRGPTGDVSDDEIIIIGDSAWRRQAGQPWRMGPVATGVGEQIRALSPPLDEAQQASADPAGVYVELRWSGADGADVVLVVDALSAMPVEQRRTDQRAGTSTIVRYHWGPTGEISPPATP